MEAGKSGNIFLWSNRENSSLDRVVEAKKSGWIKVKGFTGGFQVKVQKDK